MPNLGDTTSVETMISREEIESQLGVISVIDSNLLNQAETLLGRAALRAAGDNLGLGTIALLSLFVLQETVRKQEASLITSLQRIRDHGAGEIIITTPYIYLYMSDFGTGWYIRKGSSISTSL
jgi:hypothetical protein